MPLTEAQKQEYRFQSTSPKAMSFPHLHEAVYMDLGQGRKSDKKSYSCNWLLDPSDADLAVMYRKVLKIARDQLGLVKYTDEQLDKATGDQLAKAVANNSVALDFPFKDGTARADAAKGRGKNYEEARGKVIFKASSSGEAGKDYPPSLGGIVNGSAQDFTTPDQKAMTRKMFESGMFSHFVVGFRAYKVGNNKPGVNAYLSVVFATGEGTPIARGNSAAETFGKHIGHVSNVDPRTGDLDDEIPF